VGRSPLNQPMRVCLVTCRVYPALSASDRLYAQALERLGCTIEVLPWNDAPEGAFENCDAIVLRATWDSQDDVGGFTRWSERIEKLRPRVFNPLSLARWNNDKRTLLEFALRGIRIPRTVVLSDAITVRQALAEIGSARAVVKPCWGGSGVGVDLIDIDNAESVADRLRKELKRPLMIQEFLPEIAGGELSFIFIGQTLAHTVLKRPAPGEFRINSRYKPLPVAAIDPPAQLAADAEAVIRAVGQPTLYARIDGVVRAGRLICTEVELTDPSLFMDSAPATAERFARATIEAIRQT
jgi:hypothetical protein